MNSFSKNLNVVKSNNTFPRYIRRSKSFHRLIERGIDPVSIYEYLQDKMQRGKGTIVKVLDYILAMASNGLHCYPSTDYLARRFGVDRKHICRITRELQDLGFITKHYLGFNCTVLYRLTNIFNNAVVQYYLQDVLPTMRYIAHNFFRNTGRLMKDFFGLLSSFIMHDVTLLDKSTLTIINNKDKYEKNNFSNRENDTLSSSQQSFSYKNNNFNSSASKF